MASKVVFESKKKPITHSTEDESLMTLYDLEYTKKWTPRTKPYIPPELMPELAGLKPDPISEAFRQELLPDYERDLKPDRENYEAGTSYFQRLKERKPSIIKVVDKEVNQDAVTADHLLYDERTVYQVDYCKINDYCSEKTVGMRPKPVPDAWKPIPLTLYRLNYRDHNKMATWKIVPEPAKCPPSFFDPNPQERELLNVRTGETQYNSVIGRLGTEVMKKEYHGHIQPLPGEYIPPAAPNPTATAE
uniref:Uncharacterized protein n=1 Tax=Lygus hesperus TaxID=30085 RepID=A0A0A9W8T5_LYGHE